MKVQLLGRIAGNEESAKQEFRDAAIAVLVVGQYTSDDPVIFDPTRMWGKDFVPQDVKQEDDATFYKSSIGNLGLLNDKDNDFCVVVNEVDMNSNSCAVGEIKFAFKHDILVWQKDGDEYFIINGQDDDVKWFDCDRYPYPMSRKMMREHVAEDSKLEDDDEPVLGSCCDAGTLETLAKAVGKTFGELNKYIKIIEREAKK